MFLSMNNGPRICRFFCKGRVVEWDAPQFGEWVRRMGKAEKMVEGIRAVIVLDVWKLLRISTCDNIPLTSAHQVQTSCGWGVPLMGSEEGRSALKNRPTMSSFAAKFKESGKLQGYQAAKNAASLDGLPGLRICRRDNGDRIWLTDARARMRRVLAQKEGLMAGMGLALLMMVFVVAVARLFDVDVVRVAAKP
ncbi:hypothetical protein MMC13_001943 [Lambiella insularis]|nr:hypothetical protein [Lambiella insularis]